MFAVSVGRFIPQLFIVSLLLVAVNAEAGRSRKAEGVPGCGKSTTEAASISAAALVPALNRFTFNLNQVIAAKAESDFLFSGFSVAEALNMAYLGAGTDTREEMARVLQLDARASNEQIGAQWQSLLDKLRTPDPKVTLRIANSIWLLQRMRVNPTWEALNTKSHHAEVRRVDFQDKGFLPEINGWVSKATDGMIPSILEGPISKDQLFYLVNAIFLDAKWQTAFPVADTRIEPFEGMKDGTALMTKGRVPLFRTRGTPNRENPIRRNGQDRLLCDFDQEHEGVESIPRKSRCGLIPEVDRINGRTKGDCHFAPLQAGIRG